MANDRLIMHQMEVKGKRLAYGLRKFVDAYQLDPKSMDIDLLYVYALACIGDETCKKFAVKCPECAKVYEDLKEQKLVKDTTADKMIAESAKYVIGHSDGIVTTVKHEVAPSEEVELKMRTLELRTEANQEITKSEERTDFKVIYDNATRRVTSYDGLDAHRKAYDRMMEHYQANKKFPTEFTMDDGAVWIRVNIEDKGRKMYEITYGLGF